MPRTVLQANHLSRDEMPEFELIESQTDEDGPGGLFHSRAFFDLHAGAEARFFSWVRKSRVLARVHYTRTEPELWRSPARGTFAGYASHPALSLEGLLGFHDAVMARLNGDAAARFEVLPAPSAHDPAAFANEVYVLRSRGFDVARCDLNHSLAVNALPLTERMDYGELKRSRKCRREGLVAEPLPHSDLDAVHAMLVENRASKGRALSMSLPQLRTMATRFTDKIHLFGARDGDTLAAAAVCMRLSVRTMYVFMWGDKAAYAQHSPVVLLAEAIYAHCQTAGIELLDVGTSTEDTEANFGLIRFKRGLGFTESLKLCLRRDPGKND
jgi:hypothetical protein